MLTKEKIAQIHNDLDKAMKEVAEKHGLSLSPTRVVFNDATFKITAQFGDTDCIGSADPKFSNNMRKYGSYYNLSVKDIGLELKYGNLGNVTLMGLGSSKNAVVRNVKGDFYNIPINQFTAAIGRKPKEFGPLIVVPIPHVPTKG
jgi:hypothetical protein